MARIAQDPQIRINEILDAAEKLFAKKGYRGTTMSDIATEMSVAQGMCYYYFSSKEAILEAVCVRCADVFAARVAVIANMADISSAERVGMILNMCLMSLATENTALVEAMFAEENLQIRYRLIKQVRSAIRLSLLKLVNDGCGGGEFNVEEPRVAVDFILMTLNLLNNAFGDREATGEGHLRMAEEVIAMVLGMKTGKINIGWK